MQLISGRWQAPEAEVTFFYCYSRPEGPGVPVRSFSKFSKSLKCVCQRLLYENTLISENGRLYSKHVPKLGLPTKIFTNIPRDMI